MDNKSMFEQSVRSLAAIDDALGIGEDGCGDLEQTLYAIAELKAQAAKSHSESEQPTRLRCGGSAPLDIEAIRQSPRQFCDLETVEKLSDYALVCELRIARQERQIAELVSNLAEPSAWMLECQTPGGDTTWRLSWGRSGAGMCNRIEGEAHEIPLYALKKRDEPCGQ
ncbi:MAG: hypothetical protein PHV02_03170 [Rhodocyclaceae bacterium]|nr:hypothetical protein [Rhodocyclaceae bacterium]